MFDLGLSNVSNMLQQVLLAVNTIHEERIVHADLKPANLLLVRGSLKLIDFGTAKATMSDTTNIQRDSQVGTLSYMSAEAFMCNETDAHEITYEPVSNPWLLDLMKKCLGWDRNQRWRIPRLLQHPFLVPPIPQPSQPPDKSCKLLQLIAKSCKNDQKAVILCSRLEQMLKDPKSLVPSQASISQDEQHKLLFDMSNLCLQLNEQLVKLQKDSNINL